MTLGCTVTIDITANDKDRVGVDVVWNQESVNDPRHYVGVWYTFNLRVSMCVHINVHTRIRASPAASPT